MKRRQSEPQAIETLLKKLQSAPCQRFKKLPRDLKATKRRGVYIIYDPSGRVVHVGRTPKAAGGIMQRLRNHMHGQSSFCEHYLKGDGSKLWSAKYTYRCLVVHSNRRRALLEALAIGSLCPRHLGISAG